jgi:Protein of unknown function (DUF3631)
MIPTSHPLNMIRDFLQRFVVYPSVHELNAHTVWIVHTYLMEEWDTTPRLAALSKEPASGKSRLLEITAVLVPRPVEAVNASSAFLFRKVSDKDGRPTILYDEIDTIFGEKAKDNEETRGFLNAGFRKHSKFGRCVANKGGPFTTEEIPAFCAVAVAGLGNLPDTILSRSVIIQMKRRAPDEKVEPYRLQLIETEASQIRLSIEAWCSTCHDLIAKMKVLPQEIKDRDADVWESLIAIGDYADEDWSEAIRVSAVTLVTRQQETPPSIGLTLLSDIRNIFISNKQDSMSTKDLLKELTESFELLWGDFEYGKPLDERKLAKLLKPYSIHSVTIRGDISSHKGYKISHFADAFKRYLPNTPP